MNKRFLSVAASTAILASAIVFTGCGSSSSSSTVTPTGSSNGDNTGFFVKGLWKNVPYRTNSTSASATPVTGYNGNFTYKAGDWVEFDLGLVKVNATATNTSAIAITDSNVVVKDVATNATINSTALNNVLGAFLVVGGNQTTLETTGFDATTAIAGLKKMAASGLSANVNDFGSFQTNLGLNMTAAGISANTTNGGKAANAINLSMATDLKTAVITTAATKSAALAAATSTASLGLNASRLNNAYMIFSDGSFVRFGTGSGATANVTNVSGLTSSISSGLGTLGVVNASGNNVKFGSTNMTNYASGVVTATLSGLTKGSTVKFAVASNNTLVEKTLEKITMDMSTVTGPLNITTSLFTLNKSGASAGLTGYSLFLPNSTTAYDTSTAIHADGDYNEVLSINSSIESNTNVVSTINVSFDRNIADASNKGVVAEIVTTISSILATVKGYLTALLSAISGS